MWKWLSDLDNRVAEWSIQNSKDPEAQRKLMLEIREARREAWEDLVRKSPLSIKEITRKAVYPPTPTYPMEEIQPIKIHPTKCSYCGVSSSFHLGVCPRCGGAL